MTDMVQLTIQNQPHHFQVKEHMGQRVVTFRDIDELHKRPSRTAARNFSTNRERFVEGIDYFRLSYDEARCTNFVQLDEVTEDERSNPV